MSTTVRDTTHPGVILEYGLSSVAYRQRTDYQEVLIGDTYAFGRALFMDDVLQSTEFDEGLYHSALVHPAMFTHPAPRRVLIGGGAEGATLREVLRHPEVEHVTMVDIDEVAVAACRMHLPSWHRGAFEDPRLRLMHTDVRSVLGRGDRFDVVLLDLGDPASSEISRLAATREFYALVSGTLGAGGIVGLQAGDADLAGSATYAAFVATLRQVFRCVRPYRLGVPSFCSVWGFALAANAEFDEVPAELQARFSAAGPENFDDYDPDGHRAMMWQSPRDRCRLHSRAERILTDRVPVRLRQERAL